MANKLKPIQICRNIIRELDKASKSQNTIGKDFVMAAYRSNKTTAAQHCREQFAANHDAMTYWCLLRSLREYDQLCSHYHGKQENISAAANRVGLALPEEYDGSNNKK